MWVDPGVGVRAINRLSARSVVTLTKPGYHADGSGLYLQVSESGTKSWIFRYTLKGKAREMGLGALHTVGLAKAREQAQAAREALQQGLDPIAQRDAARATRESVPTFRVAAAAYIEQLRPSWRNAKHAEQWASTLATYAHPVMGDRRVDDISTDQVLRVLEPIWTTKTETANRVRQRIEQILDWCAAKKLRPPENPARWKGHLDKILPPPARVRQVRHFPALPYSDMPAFMVALRKRLGVDARALEFTILTAARTSMVVGAQWAEIDGDLWTVPADRMKARRDHVVPLCRQLRRLLADLPRLGEHVFPGFKGRAHISPGTMDALLQRRMGYGTVTVHGFRSTFKDWATELTAFPNLVSEAALAHVVKDKTEAAYRRGQMLDKRRELMQAWADYCDGVALKQWLAEAG